MTVDQVEQLKKMALRSVTDRHKVQDVYKRQARVILDGLKGLLTSTLFSGFA